jgi:hypothetical protein
LLNVPKEELESFEQIMFLLEQAHWFYENTSIERNPNLKFLCPRRSSLECAWERLGIRYAMLWPARLVDPVDFVVHVLQI